MSGKSIGYFRTKVRSLILHCHYASRNIGFNFPPRDLTAATSAMIDTQTAPEWIDSDVCLRCRTAFTFTNRKHHCRLCGKIICSLPVKRPQRPVPCSLLFVANSKTGRLEEVSEGVDYGVRPRSRTNSMNGKSKGPPVEETFLKGVRICKDCKPTML